MDSLFLGLLEPNNNRSGEKVDNLPEFRVSGYKKVVNLTAQQTSNRVACSPDDHYMVITKSLPDHRNRAGIEQGQFRENIGLEQG